MSFDWQTEEDGEWEDRTWQETRETAVPPKTPWRTILIIVVLISVAGVIIYRQFNDRLDETTLAVESDIFASHNLLSRAASNQDGDLGKAVLSGRDKGWSQVQTDLIGNGLFYENPTFGLSLTDTTTAYEPLFRENERFIDLQIDPDLSGAELSYTRDYMAFTGDGLQTVTLQQTAVYRRGETRWLLSPPLDEFWGEWQTAEDENITFIYPLRDEEVVLQLIEDLPDLLEEVCQELTELNCSSDTSIQIRFDTDPESLLESADPANLYEAHLRLNLPAPTLVGLPIDNDGYQALRNAYGAQLVAALISERIAYECCHHAPMFQTIMIYQLSELGLANWPVTQEIQQALANSGVHTELVFPYWNKTNFSLIHDENSDQLFGFVDFLLKQHVASETPIWLMSRLDNMSRGYQSWLVNLTDQTPSVEVISQDWWFYALTQSEVLASSVRPISLPAQDLQVGCIDEESMDETSQTVLYRYELGSETWQEEFAYTGLTFFNPLPQDDGVILQLIEVSEDLFWQTLLWQNGRSTELMNLGNVYSISLGQMDPNGRFLLSYFGNEEEESLPEPLLIDMESCLAGTCNSTVMTQTPYWSPNGQRLLLSDIHLFESTQYRVDGRIIALNLMESAYQSSPLWLRDALAEPAEAVQVGEGSSPFWINNEQFGYIRTMPDESRPVSQELVVASVANLEPQTILKTADLDEIISDRLTRNPLVMQYAIAHPTDENFLILMVSTQARDSYLLLMNRQTQETSVLFSLDLSRGEHSLGFSPDGRFLVATGSLWQDVAQRDESLFFGVLRLYDFETGNQKNILINTDSFFPAFTFDWSRDGNWLAFTRDSNVISLMAPAYDYQQTIMHEEGNCTSLAWINPLPPD